MKSGVSSARPAVPRPARIRALVAQDDPSLRLPVTEALRSNGYEVKELPQGNMLLDLVRTDAFDLILLDIKTPGLRQGIENCRQLRELSPRSGIVIVTRPEPREQSESESKIRGLEAGADDYLTAPFDPREFHARLRAVLRRVRPHEPLGALVKVGDLEMDLPRRIVQQNGKSIHLTRTEFDLLALMMQRPGTPIPHVQLLRSVWGPEYGNELEYLRAYIRLLRRKIEADPSKPAYILTEPGVGYRFQDPLAG